MTLLSAAAAIVLLAFLAWRASRNPLFLAGAAAFVALGRSAFIDLIPDQVVANTPVLSVMTGDILFAAVALGWLYARRRRPTPRVRLSARWVGLGLGVLFFLGLELALTLTSPGGFHAASMLGPRDWFYIPLGYLLTLDILRRFTADETAQYVGVLSLFTTCLMVLYIASALDVPIYPYPKFLTISFGGATIIRDFTTMPIWLGLAWGYYLSQPKKNGWTFAALAVLAGGTMLTYSRSLILVLAASAGLAIVLLIARRGQRARALVVGAASAALAVAVLVGGPALAPRQYGYLIARVGSERLGSVLTEGTLVGRMDNFQQGRVAGSLVDPVFGAGLFGAPHGTSRSFDSYDSDWIRIVYRTGWAGVVVFAAPLILALWWGVSGFFRQRASSTTGRLLLTAVLATAFYAMGRFTTITYFWWPALSLFSVALMAYAAGCPMAGTAAVSGPVDRRDEPARLTSGL